MSFIGDLFGGGSSTPAPIIQPAAPPPPTVVPSSVAPTPTISDAAGYSAEMEAASRQGRRYGTDRTILSTGLGDTGADAGNVNRTSALGGNTSLSQDS